MNHNFFKPYLLLLVTITCAINKGNTQKNVQPNIIFIIADDLNTDLGCYNHSLVKTPNIDDLANDGLLYKNTYCQIPLCGPSRTSILTGIQPKNLTVLCNETSFRDLRPDIKTLPQMFKENGYKSVRFGKIFHQSMPSKTQFVSIDDPQSWDEIYDPLGYEIELYDGADSYLDDNSNYNYAFAKDSNHISLHSDELSAEKATAFIKANKKPKKPFFLAVGFYRPHSPYIAPIKYFDMYPLNSITLPKDIMADTLKYPKMAYNGNNPYKFNSMTNLKRKQITQAYYAAISFMDAQVGKIINALKENDLYNNSIIVFTSDHGYALGEHGMWQKQTLYEKVLRVPLILKLPNHALKNIEPTNFSELIDIFPTLMDLAKIKKPQHLDGVSLLSQAARDKSITFSTVGRLMPNKKFNTKHLNCNFFLAGTSIRKDSLRFTIWKDSNKSKELFNYLNDPEELKNIIKDTIYSDFIKSVSSYLN